MTSTTIRKVQAWEALDSRGKPTVGCVVSLAGGASGCAIVPSGASTGQFEVHELRDGGSRYGGAGVRRAVAAVVGELASAVTGLDAADQSRVDATLVATDGTPDLHRLGGNAVLAVSVASCLAAASAAMRPLYRWVCGDAEPVLPMPMVNIISGGAHAGRAIDVQDCLVVPLGARSFSEAIEWAARVREGTARAAERRGFNASLVADEGGLAFPLTRNTEAIELVVEGIEQAGLVPGRDAAIAIDVAANQFFDSSSGAYVLRTERRSLSADELIGEIEHWIDQYPIVSVEDALRDDDWEAWARLTARLGGRIQLIGDDLLATNPARLTRATGQRVANSVLVKPNQIGTLSQAGRLVAQARAGKYASIVSARSGETEDAWLADLAVGWRAGQIKVGSTMRSERTAKWNRLLWIEQELGKHARFAGRDALAPLS